MRLFHLYLWPVASRIAIALIMPILAMRAVYCADVRDVTIAVTAVGDLAAYAAVTDYLESLPAVEAVAVEQLARDAVTYRLRVSGGDTGELVRAIELNTHLRPTSDSRSANLGANAAMAGA